MLIHNSAFKRNAQINGQLVKRILNVFQPSKTVRKNAEPSNHAGNFAFQLKEVKLLLMLPNALLLTTVFNHKHSLMHLKHACQKHAQTHSLNAYLMSHAELILESAEMLKKFGTSLLNVCQLSPNSMRNSTHFSTVLEKANVFDCPSIQY